MPKAQVLDVEKEWQECFGVLLVGAPIEQIREMRKAFFMGMLCFGNLSAYLPEDDEECEEIVREVHFLQVWLIKIICW